MLRSKIMGSSYVGLFCLANDSLCFVPKGIEERALKEIEKTLNVKTVKITIYDSYLLPVFGKMNNKKMFLPSQIKPRELEEIEKEISVELLNTESALGNLLVVNDYGAVISKTLSSEIVKDIQKTGLETTHTNIAKTDVVGSSLLSTSKGFVMNPNASPEEVKAVQETLKVKGGFSTANTGDVFVSNSIIANKNGVIAGDLTTGHELNHIDEALGGDEK